MNQKLQWYQQVENKMKVTIWVKPEHLEKLNKLLESNNSFTEKDYLGINFSTIPDVEMIQVQIDSDKFIEFLDRRGNKCKSVLLG